MNSLYFDNRKYADEFIKFILDYNQDPDNENYFETHIYQEENGIIVEFDKVPYSGEWGGRFEYVDEEHKIVEEVILPDNSIITADTYMEKFELLEDWFKEHPEVDKIRYSYLYR